VLTGPQLDKKFHACYGNKCFITASQDPVTCPCPKPHQVRPYPSTSLLILILSHLRQCLPSDLFPSGFSTKTLYEPLLSCILPCSLRARCLSQYPIVEHPQLMFFPRCETKFHTRTKHQSKL